MLPLIEKFWGAISLTEKMGTSGPVLLQSCAVLALKEKTLWDMNGDPDLPKHTPLFAFSFPHLPDAWDAEGCSESKEQ